MTLNPTWIDYCNNAFEFVNLTKIHGEPTFESIRTLQRELIINAHCVHTHLGGGAHGHLGLVLSPREYAMHSNAAYFRLAHPGALRIPPETAPHLADTIRDQHKEQVRLFREVQGVEQALCQQITTAIESQYLEAFRDVNIGRITLPISDLICQLYQMYGKVTPQKLQDKEDKVRQMAYDPVNPIDGIFTAINELVHYSTAANAPYTQSQTINMAYLLLNKTGVFRRWILDWNAQPPAQKIWINFKLHFRAAHQQLCETTNLEQRESSFHANAAQEIIEELKHELRQCTSKDADSYAHPPSTISISTVSNDTASTISALQSEVNSL